MCYLTSLGTEEMSISFTDIVVVLWEMLWRKK
jgi:hypothetical protein